MPIRWIDAGRVSGYRSQSIYHGLGYAQTPETPDTIVTVVPEDSYICIGYFQDAGKEVDLNFCKKNKMPVIRRETGGGTVFIDSGQLFVQWICQPGFLPRKVEQRFQLFNQAIVETYKFFDIQAYHYPKNDVHVGGKKITGTGAATIGEAEVVTGNFLFNFNIDVMTNALKLPNPDFREAIKKGLENYMTWIGREKNKIPSYQEVIDVYKQQCHKILGIDIVESELSEDEMRAIQKVEKRFHSHNWLHSVKSPPSKNRLVKIHAGVWIGWMEYEIEGFPFTTFFQIRNNEVEKIEFHVPNSIGLSWDIHQLEYVLISTPLQIEILENRVKEFFSIHGIKETLTSPENWAHAVMRIKEEIVKVSGHA